ncbi:acetyl-CoA carboxylase biotin carboxyl carrier protein [Nocardia sp. NPDC101769]|uniref:acetyl-CoA carboxylase biotin carboxyl carrier protein n=1 Tax=Nocardia sp. NPDC101769 TaxID=3364333 RepID=UPI0037FBD178
MGSDSSKSGSPIEFILAPYDGTFSRTLDGNKPLVMEGDHVSTGTVVCVIEPDPIEMGDVLIEVESDTDGTIVDFLVQNMGKVSSGQPLIRIRKS